MIFLYLIQLTLSLFLFMPATIIIIGSLRYPGRGSRFGIMVGIVIMILSALNILWASYYASKYSNMGFFEMPMMMQNMQP